MAHLWVKAENDGEFVWNVAVLDCSKVYTVSGHGPAVVEDSPVVSGQAPDMLLLAHAAQSCDEQWILIASAGSATAVNGRPIHPTGIRVLRDRDEMLLQTESEKRARRWFFSTERLAEIEAFPGADPAVPCARCKQPMAENEPAIRCPNCGRWHHQTEMLPCWTYAATCAGCHDQPTEEAGYRWSPEEL